MTLRTLLIWASLVGVVSSSRADEAIGRLPGLDPNGVRSVYVLPVQDAIMPPLTYLIRRGVKEAMDAGADMIVLNMNTDGGRVDVTEEIIDIIGKFPGYSLTYVDQRAFSAGAFIAVATDAIFMNPDAVIGAAAPIMMIPGGGPAELPASIEEKMNSAIRALVRTQAQKNGYNVDVVMAMIDKDREVIIDGKVISEKGKLLTLTAQEAEEKFGSPPKNLLSSGTVDSLETLLDRLGLNRDVKITYVEPTGVEKLATWINAISSLLLLAGIVGLYIEFKTPGFGVPGIIGIGAFLLYFAGSYLAGLSGLEWLAVFALGLALIFAELFFFQGSMIAGLTGFVMVMISLLMAMVDTYPGMPAIPSLSMLRGPITDMSIAFAGALAAILVLSRFLPKTSFYGELVSLSTSASLSIKEESETRRILSGAKGIAVSRLCPGGKAQFDEQLLDVITRGELLEAGTQLEIVDFSGNQPIVRALT